VTFRYGEFGFGVRVEEVAGLVEADRLAPLPRQCDGLAGVIAFRGEMVPVLHLASYLGLETPPAAGRGYAVVLGRGAERFGILVHELPRLIPAGELRPAVVSTEANAELDGLIVSVFQAKDVPYHCLDYERILDSIIPPAGAGAAPRAGRR
jgi:chemotaxis signal transduction protein